MPLQPGAGGGVARLDGESVLITGASGFIGANLARALVAEGAEVHAIVRASTSLWRIENLLDRVTLHRADIVDAVALRQAMSRARPDVIYHLAMAHGHPTSADQREAVLRSGVIGTAVLLGASAGVGYRRLIHIGSSLEYGPRSSPLSETDSLSPTTFRGVTKAVAALLCRAAAIGEGKPITIVRPFSVYGPWEASHRFVPTVIRAGLIGGDIALTAPGFRRDYVFVMDVVEACIAAARADTSAGEVINVGSNRQHANEELVQLVREITGSEIPARIGEYPARPSDTGHWIADIGKARRLLNWQPKHSLREGLEKTVAWFRERESREGASRG